MKFHPFVKLACPVLALALACLLPTPAPGQAAAAITLEPPTGLDLQAHAFNSKGEPLPAAPANFQRLGEARMGQVADLHTLTLRINQTTRITEISISKDFKIEQGGSCVKGNVYEKGSTCRMLVRFTPQGPGNRLGNLKVSHTASPTPDSFGLGGTAYMPVISFIPAPLSTVPGTYPSNAGLLSGATKLAVDGGDLLYIADTGNSLIRKIDSGGAIANVTPDYGAPVSIAVDSLGFAWTLNASGGTFYLSVYSPWSSNGGDFGYAYVNKTCTVNSPCSFATTGMSNPAEISIDSSNNLFMEEKTTGALEMPVGAYPGGNFSLNLWHLNDTYAYYGSSSRTFAVDPNGDNLFNAVNFPLQNICLIVEEPLYEAEGSSPNFTRVAGASFCGFSGDGGLAANAEITAIGQMAFDAAGDLYFTDIYNQRVRRVDYATGIIRTIAGNGAAGYLDSSSAISGELNVPSGLGVDSLGQVYIVSNTGVGSAQVVRKVGNTGYATMGTLVLNTSSLPKTVTLTNTGNYDLAITNTAMGGTNPSDFSVDPGTTTCLLTPGSSLTAGRTCQIGFVLKPSATGARHAVFTILDNTANLSNIINLSGTGILPSASLKITSPANNASFTSGSTVKFSLSVTSGSSPAPTGTVQFKVDGVNSGSPVTISSGTASTNLTGLTTAAHTLSATYSGDSNYAAGGPISVAITVTTGANPPPQVSLTPVMQPATSCHPNEFQVTVTSASGVPTGSVQLLNGSSLLAASKLSGGQALLAPPSLPYGMYSFTARYGGDTLNQPAVSPVLNVNIAVPPDCGRTWVFPQPH